MHIDVSMGTPADMCTAVLVDYAHVYRCVYKRVHRHMCRHAMDICGDCAHLYRRAHAQMCAGRHTYRHVRTAWHMFTCSPYIVMGYMVMACTVTAYIVTAYIVMAYIAMADTVMYDYGVRTNAHAHVRGVYRP